MKETSPLKQRALEIEAKRKAREAAGEPAPISPYTEQQRQQLRHGERPDMAALVRRAGR